MPMKTVLIAVFVSMSATHSFAQSVLTAGPQDIFRDYALTECLGLAFPELGPEANAAANGYVQYGDGPFEAYQKVARLAQEYLRRDYPSQAGAKLSIMKCIDFSRSAEVTKIIQQQIPKTKFKFKRQG